MLKAEVAIGKVYVVKVSGKLCRVKITREADYLGKMHGWFGENLSTGREVRIRSAAKLRREADDRVIRACSACGRKFYGPDKISPIYCKSCAKPNLALEIASGLNNQTHEG